MKNRKRLAVLMASIMYKGYQHPLLEGILQQAFALDYDVCIFSPFMISNVKNDYQSGENRIFDLVHYEMFDAVLYAPCAFYNDDIRKLVEQKLEENCRIPVIAIESDDPRYHDIQMDDLHAFARVTDHLIEKHHVTKIWCLTGFKDNWHAEQRQLGYRLSMQNHGLPVPEGYVIYGDFWKQAATDLAEKIANHEVEMPEAVVCCCDTVAITLTNHLIELGVRVPEDLLVASYDRGEEAQDNIPSITTYVRPVSDMGMRAVIRAHELITGETASPVGQDHGYLVPADSCGCGHDFHQQFELRQREIREDIDRRTLFEGTPMAEWLNAKSTLNELLSGITHFFYLVTDLQEWYLCLCDEWDDLSKATGDPSCFNTYTPTMHLCIKNDSKTASVVDEKFPLEDLLPALHEDRDEPRAYYFTPIHFNDRCLGYSALSYGNSFKAYDSLYHAWNRNLNNALEFMRIRNNMSSMNQRLFTSSIRDTLTGIYNRHGYTHFAGDVFEKARENAPDKKLLIFAADLDCLKVINDTYGHLEGDNAIAVVANALNTCFSFGEICARTGGDEFLVIGCGDYTEEILKQYIKYIQNFCDRYNAESGKPYEVGVSVGYYCDTVREGDTLDALTEIADARMYANKVARKKLRQ